MKAQLAALSAEEIDIRVTDSGVTEVLGDVSRVKVDLEALARNPVAFKLELEEADLQGELARVLAELESLDGKTATPDVEVRTDAALAKLAQVLVALQAIDGKRAKLGIDVDADTAGAQAHIDAFIARQRLRNKITLDVDIDRGRLGIAADGIFRSLSSVFSGIGSTLTNIVGKAASGVSDHFDEMGAALGKTLGIAGKLTQVILQVGGYSLLAATAGAAITAAWGAVATAVAAIPAAISLIGAAGATVALGMDGIKKAAQSIKPEFDKLKASVSDTFEKGLTPVFQRLATIFPKVQGSITNVANALVLTASNLTTFITSATGVSLLEGIFNRTATAIRNMQPGIQDAVHGFLIMANQTGVFDALVGAVNTFGRAFKASVIDLVQDGTVSAAFRGLQGTLESLARAFVGLVDNGIRVFANAAPGLNALLNELSHFFGAFDFGALGQSVGNVFRGLAQAIAGVPPGTVAAIQAAFSRLGQVFLDPGFQSGIQNILASLPALIDQIGAFSSDFVGAAEAIGAAVSVFNTVDQAFRDLSSSIEGFGTSISKWLGTDSWTPALTAFDDSIDRFLGIIPDKVEQAGQDTQESGTSAFSTAWQSIVDTVSGLGSSIAAAWGSVAQFFSNTWDTISGNAETAWNSITSTISRAAGLVTSAVSSAWSGLTSAVSGVWQSITSAVSSAWQGIVSTIASIAGTLGPILQSVWQGIQLGAVFAFEFIKLGLQDAFNGLISIARSAGESLAATFGPIWGRIVSVVSTAWTAITAAVSTGAAAVGAILGPIWTGIATAASVAWTAVTAAVSTAWAAITTVITTGVTFVTTVMSTAWAGISAAASAAWLAVSTAVSAAWTVITAAVSVGVTAVTTVMSTAWAGISAAASVAWAAVSTAVSAAWASITAVVSAGAAAVSAVAASAWAAISSTAATAWAAVTAVVSSAWASIRSVVSAGAAAVSAVVSAGWNAVSSVTASAWNSIRSVISSAWASIQSVVSSGMAAIRNVVASGVAAIVAAFRSLASQAIAALQSMVSQAASVGRAVISGLLNGLRSGAGAVIGYLRDLASRALAAAKSALGIASPSREFMKLGVFIAEGLAVGMESSAPRVADAAEKMANAAIDSADRITAAFSGDQWATDFNAKIEASFGDAEASLSTKDVVGQLRKLNGNVDQSGYLSAIVALLQAIYAQNQGGTGAALGAQSSRRAAELGAF